MGGGEGEVSADGGEEGGEGDEEPELTRGGRCDGPGMTGLVVGTGEQAGGHQGERGQRGEAVVLLPAGEGEEAEDDQAQSKSERAASCWRAVARSLWRRSRTC